GFLVLEGIPEITAHQIAHIRDVLQYRRCVEASIVDELLPLLRGQLPGVFAGQMRERTARHQARQDEIQTQRDQQDESILAGFANDEADQWPNPGMNDSFV